MAKKPPADEGRISDQVYKAFEKNDKEKKGGPKEGSKKEEAMDKKQMQRMHQKK